MVLRVTVGERALNRDGTARCSGVLAMACLASDYLHVERAVARTVELAEIYALPYAEHQGTVMDWNGLGRSDEA